MPVSYNQSMKKCYKCHQYKPTTEFYRNKANKDGVCSECKDCSRKICALYREKNRDYFNAHALKYYHDHKEKRNAERAQKRADNRAYVDEIKSVTPCADCKKIFQAICMDFDHLPGFKKYKDISKLAANSTTAAIDEEMKKCEIVCSNCHRIRTLNRRLNAKSTK